MLGAKLHDGLNGKTKLPQALIKIITKTGHTESVTASGTQTASDSTRVRSVPGD